MPNPAPETEAAALPAKIDSIKAGTITGISGRVIMIKASVSSLSPVSESDMILDFIDRNKLAAVFNLSPDK